MGEGLVFKKLAQRTKWRRTGMMVEIALVASLMVGAGGIQYIKVAAKRQTAQENRFFDLASQVMAPNIQSSDQFISNNGLVTTQLTSHRYKQIEGQRIPWSPMVATYSWWGGAPLPTRLNSLDGDRSSYDVVTQQKVPVFYNDHRRLDKGEPRQLAVQEVQQVARNRGYVAEAALSFEHPLTYQQIRQKLPVGVHPAWYWLGVTGDADTTLMDNNFLGIQAETAQGSLTTRGYQEFRQQLAQASRSGFSLTYGTFNVFQYAGKYAKKHPTLATARFAGAIVTGESSRFKALDQAAWVEASSVGVFQRQQTIR
ncbi:MAG TPA: anti-sigma factor [Candidatus Levilactobacillus faecigallinarum]|uniref:Anti-sigma factor n=1 Tax=Candidatus Levilactobacillus faecigallinarum TaxID=2838638 RepID=A0A9D1QUJ9_9LACO|nr:anti-sigma factor [Candidatus Levilactobacillus faecigallinarum]